MVVLGYVGLVKVFEVRDLAMDLIYELNLSVSDALILAAAVDRGVNLFTDDKHLLRDDVLRFARDHGVNVFPLERIKSIE